MCSICMSLGLEKHIWDSLFTSVFQVRNTSRLFFTFGAELWASGHAFQQGPRIFVQQGRHASGRGPLCAVPRLATEQLGHRTSRSRWSLELLKGFLADGSWNWGKTWENCMMYDLLWNLSNVVATPTETFHMFSTCFQLSWYPNIASPIDHPKSVVSPVEHCQKSTNTKAGAFCTFPGKPFRYCMLRSSTLTAMTCSPQPRVWFLWSGFTVSVKVCKNMELYSAVCYVLIMYW